MGSGPDWLELKALVRGRIGQVGWRETVQCLPQCLNKQFKLYLVENGVICEGFMEEYVIQSDLYLD